MNAAAPSVIVTDRGFADDDWTGGAAPLAEAAGGAAGVSLGPETDPAGLTDRLGDLAMIRVEFPSFDDGRGFTIARQLRLMGFGGRLRAAGHVIADQYAMARRAGFDEVEISADLAARQPESHWLARANWRDHDYQARLRGAPPSPRPDQPLRDADAARPAGAGAMTDTSPAKTARAAGDAQTVTQVRHWTDRLFSFRTTRPASLRFRSGEFVMLGLMQDDPQTGRGKPLLRAYSIASPSWDSELEFYSIKVPDGPLTSRLQHVKPGDEIVLRPKPVGTLVHDALLPGRRLWLFATGTGIAPFASLLRDPQTYGDYGEVFLVHACRERAELAYGLELVEAIRTDAALEELVGAGFHHRLRHYPTTTREPSARTGRITDLIRNGRLFEDLGAAPLDAAGDRAMVCGNLAFNLELKALLEERGLREGANSAPGEYVVEKAFLD